MPLTATAGSCGDTLRQEVLVAGRHRLVTDEPWRLGGTDAGPAPRLMRVAEACPVRRAFEAGIVVHEALAEPDARVA